MIAVSPNPANDYSSDLEPFLELGIPQEQAEKAVRYLRADGSGNGTLVSRSRRLARLAHACGGLQNAKLAYSLAVRAGGEPDDQGVHLLSACLTRCECVPAAVRLWKTAIEAGIQDEALLMTAAWLGGDGSETVQLLGYLRQHPEKAAHAHALARQLAAPGWQAEGSWGGRPDAERSMVWWDFARASERVAFGMSLLSDPISLVAKVGTRFRFQARWEILGVTDRCHLEITRDGGKTWDKLARYEGSSDWCEQTFDLQPYDGRVVRLRFHVLSGGQREGRGFEMASPRLETVPVTRRVAPSFADSPQGWQRRLGEDRSEILSGHQSESPWSSQPLELPAMECPTLTLEARLQASSVYAHAAVEALGPEGEALQLAVPTSTDWKGLRLALPAGSEPWTFRLTARFNARKEEDGLWVRRVIIQGGEPGRQEVIPLDGGGEDGERERSELVRLLRSDDALRLQELAELRRGLPSLRSALALLPLIQAPEHVAVLLDLFSQLKDQAIPSFRLLLELAAGDDLALQSRVLLASGPALYSSTRDYLGDGLVSPSEFEEHCHLYLRLRQNWSEETARAALSLLMTPIAGEELGERTGVFRRLLESHQRPEDFFHAWEHAWEGEAGA